MNKNNRNLILLTPALLILGAVLALAICMAEPETADAAVAIVDYDSSYVNKRAAIYTESYDYYFVLESTPEQGRKLVLSTEPFTVTCDGVQDASGAYTVELSSPGGNVYVRHFAQGQFQSYDARYENCGSGAVLRFRYWGQVYKTNIDFSSPNGLEFNRTVNITDGVMYSMMSYLKSQDILFERYPYYIFGYNPENNRYLMYLTESDLAKAATNSYVYCFFDATEMKISGFNVVTGSPYLPNSMQSRMKAALNDITITETTNYGARYISIYSNMTDNGEPASYFYPNPWPGYEAFTGTSVPTPAPTPTPTPAPAVTYQYINSSHGIRNITLTQGSAGWRVDFLADPFSYNGLNCSDVYVTARIVLPSRKYVQEHFLTAPDREELTESGAVSTWRVDGDADSRMNVLFDYVYKDAILGFRMDELKQLMLDNWASLYGDAVPKGYINEVMSYAYVGVLAVRVQGKADSTLTYIGPTTVTYPVKYYLSYEEYGKELGLVGGYDEILLKESTAGMTLTQMQEKASATLKGEAGKTEGKLEESNATVKELKDKIAELNEEIAHLQEQLTISLKAQLGIGSNGAGGLFTVFQSLADGFADSVAGFGSIARAVGSVFAFLPAEVTAVIGLSFISLLVIALYHALRG